MGLIWYIALGSAIGGAGRFLVAELVQRAATTTFPTGTLAVNLTGSFLLGFIVRYAIETPAVSPELRAFLTIGICGGYTTFSTFSFETVRMLEDGEWMRASLYVGSSLVLAVGAVFLGFAAARQLVALRAG
ncbi:MAG TPA: fluoride efflux transporter CrcB [Gemmatimonadales bacterium]|jgi:CrcB protein|nr:fluoride efflux transporter CrcB [Gemmatimonadales bacterium]